MPACGGGAACFFLLVFDSSSIPRRSRWRSVKRGSSRACCTAAVRAGDGCRSFGKSRRSRAFRLRSPCTIQPSEIEARSSSSSLIFARASSRLVLARRRGSRQNMPAAIAKAASASAPVTPAKTTIRVTPEIGPKKKAGTRKTRRRSRRPARSAAARPRCAAGKKQRRRRRSPQRATTSKAPALAIKRTMREQPPAEDRHRQHQHGRRQAKQLHQQVGGDRALHAEHIAHRRIGGVAQARVLHRPGGERGRAGEGERDQAKPASSRKRRRSTSLQVVGDDRECYRGRDR